MYSLHTKLIPFLAFVLLSFSTTEIAKEDFNPFHVPNEGPSHWAWFPSTLRFCKIDMSTGNLSLCFSLTDNYNMGPSGAVFSNFIYITGENSSKQTRPLEVLAVNFSNKSISWSMEIKTTYRSATTTYSNVLSKVVINIGGGFGETYFVNSTGALLIDTGTGLFSRISTFDVARQQFWALIQSSPSRLGYFDLFGKSWAFYPNQWNFVQIAASQNSAVIYGLVPAADATLLYTYLTTTMQFHLVGFIPECIVIPFEAAVLDSSQQYLSFQCQGGLSTMLYTISVADASVVMKVIAPESSIILLQQF